MARGLRWWGVSRTPLAHAHPLMGCLPACLGELLGVAGRGAWARAWSHAATGAERPGSQARVLEHSAASPPPTLPRARCHGSSGSSKVRCRAVQHPGAPSSSAPQQSQNLRAGARAVAGWPWLRAWRISHHHQVAQRAAPSPQQPRAAHHAAQRVLGCAALPTTANGLVWCVRCGGGGSGEGVEARGARGALAEGHMPAPPRRGSRERMPLPAPRQSTARCGSGRRWAGCRWGQTAACSDGTCAAGGGGVPTLPLPPPPRR